MPSAVTSTSVCTWGCAMTLAAECTADGGWKEVVLVFGITKCWKQSSSGGKEDLSLKKQECQKKKTGRKRNHTKQNKPQTIYTRSMLQTVLLLIDSLRVESPHSPVLL